MNALFTLLQARVRRRERRTRRSSSPDFTEPSVTITSTVICHHRQRQRRRQQQQDRHVQNDGSNHNEYHHDDERTEQGGGGGVDEDKSLSFLYQLCKRWAWPAVLFRAEKFPEEASCCETNIDGDSLLHWVCFGSPPIEVVVTLLSANPKLAQIANDRGSLPLHVACSYRASSSVIKKLIDVYPESVDKPNNQGSYPLHILCDYGCDIDSIQAVLQHSIQSVLLEDCLYRRKPLLILNERKNMHEFHDSLQTLRLANALGNGYSINNDNNGNNAVQSSLTKDTLLSRCRRMAFWKKACLLICAEYSNLTSTKTLESMSAAPSNQPQQQPHNNQTMMEYKDDDDDDATNHDNSGNESSSSLLSYGIINACLQIQDCPPALLEFAVLVRADEELLSPSTTDNGQLPIHIAVQKSSITTILDILNAQRKAARYPHPKTGKFVLQSFLERFPDAPYSGVVDQIIPANPLALHSIPNVDKRLFPLIYEKLVVTKDFDSIFESIRGNPPLLFG